MPKYLFIVSESRSVLQWYTASLGSQLSTHTDTHPNTSEGAKEGWKWIEEVSPPSTGASVLSITRSRPNTTLGSTAIELRFIIAPCPTHGPRHDSHLFHCSIHHLTSAQTRRKHNLCRHSHCWRQKSSTDARLRVQPERKRPARCLFVEIKRRCFG